MLHVVKLRPDFANVWGGLGYAAYRLGDYREAVR